MKSRSIVRSVQVKCDEANRKDFQGTGGGGGSLIVKINVIIQVPFWASGFEKGPRIIKGELLSPTP